MSGARITICQLLSLKSKDEVPYLYTELTWRVLIGAGLLVAGLILGTAIKIAGSNDGGACGTLGCATVSPKFLVTDTAGKRLFTDNCVACHHTTRDAAGPALQPALMNRPPAFLQAHLHSYGTRRPDSLSMHYLETFAPTKCMGFPALDSMEIAHIRRYVLQI